MQKLGRLPSRSLPQSPLLCAVMCHQQKGAHSLLLLHLAESAADVANLQGMKG